MAGPPARHIDTLLLLGLPACGKSVIRCYLSAEANHSLEAGLGPTIQLDDFPYVAFMWQIHGIVAEAGFGPTFFDDTGVRFADLRAWSALIHLINEDHAALVDPRPVPERPAGWVIERLEHAYALAGIGSPFTGLPTAARQAALDGIAGAAEAFATEWVARGRPPGSTVVIEFARGGPADADPPMTPPFGYGHAFSLLSAEILRRAAVLYVWVTSEQSRARNHERARPGAQGTTLHHAVPDAAMDAYYGRDDMNWLIEQSDHPDTITVRAHGSTYHMPFARFDNRREVAALRGDEPPGQGREIDERTSSGLRAAFEKLARPS